MQGAPVPPWAELCRPCRGWTCRQRHSGCCIPYKLSLPAHVRGKTRGKFPRAAAFVINVRSRAGRRDLSYKLRTLKSRFLGRRRPRNDNVAGCAAARGNQLFFLEYSE